MKQFILSLIILFSAATFAAPHQPEKPQTKKAETKVETQTDIQEHDSCQSDDTYVYVCTGPSAYAYHKTDKCQAFNRCTGSAVRKTLKQAKEGGWSKPCGYCYKN